MVPDTRSLLLPCRSLQCWTRSLQAGVRRLGACCAVSQLVAVLHAFCRQGMWDHGDSPPLLAELLSGTFPWPDPRHAAVQVSPMVPRRDSGLNGWTILTSMLLEFQPATEPTFQLELQGSQQHPQVHHCEGVLPLQVHKITLICMMERHHLLDR